MNNPLWQWHHVAHITAIVSCVRERELEKAMGKLLGVSQDRRSSIIYSLVTLAMSRCRVHYSKR